MKRLTYLLVVFAVTACSSVKNTTGSTAHYTYADSLLEQKDVFLARDYIAANHDRFGKMHQGLLDAKINHAFNKPELSNKDRTTLFS